MKIARTRVRRFGGALARPAGNARASWSSREGLLLQLEDEAGRVGQGEASPLPGCSPDTVEACEAILRGLRWSEAAGARASAQDAPSVAPPAAPLPPPAPTSQVDELAAAVASVMDPVGALRTSPAARFAVETALLDLVGQRAGLSVAALLGGETARQSVPLNAWIQETDPEAAAREAAQALARGIRTVKLKVGSPGGFARELDLARTLRARFGETIALRFDANGGWTREEARTNLERLAEFSPEYVEQPVAARALPELAGSPVPLAADETLQDARATERLLDPSAPAHASCRVLVLKPMVLGGFLPCRRLALRAAACGMEVVVSHLLDGPVALAAAAELALSLPGMVRACGLDRHRGLAAWPDLALPQVGANAISQHAGVGLGLARIGEAGGQR